MTEEPKYTIGDPVWSKMKGYCPWPSRIAAPFESLLKNTNADKQKIPKIFYLVYFFGSNNFAWMPEDCIKPYADFKEKNKSGSKNASFKQGLKAIEEYIATDGKTKLLESYREWQEQNNTNTAAIKNNSSNNDLANSPSPASDSLNNDSTNLDGDLPSIDEEIAAINNRKPAAVSPKKQKFDSQNSDSLSSPSSVQRDYSRTPFKTKSKTAVRGDDPPNPEPISPTKRAKTSEFEPSNVSPSLSSSTTSTYSKQPINKSGPRNVLIRATQHSDLLPEERPNVVMDNSSSKLKSIRPSALRFGFIGLGFLGQRLLKNLINSGHQVSIYNRSDHKYKQFLEAGAKKQDTPADVIENSDIVFSCVSGPDANKEVVFGTFGIITKMDPTKAYVEMSGIDPITSNDISEAITERGGRYLEAPAIANGRQAAESGDLTIVAAGEKSLYEDCTTCFQAMSKQTFFLGHQVGYASKMNLIVSTLYGNICGALAECCALVERSDLQLKTLQEILKLSIMNSPLIEIMMDKTIRKDNSVHMPLNQLQKDMRLAIGIAEDSDQACPITCITNEIFKQSKKFGYGEFDVAAIFLKSRW